MNHLNRWILLILCFLFCCPAVQANEQERRNHVVIVGAGISGLVAAWELAQKDIDVTVLEMSPIYGGAGITSEGAICIIGTPEQEQSGIKDSAQMAFDDFMTYGRDDQGPGPNKEWVRYYVDESRREIYDWLAQLGVRFEKKVILMPGNSVPRWHKVTGKGRGLLEPIYKDCKKMKRVSFVFRTKAVSLLRNGNRIQGVRAERLKDGKRIDYPASAVILATGGFQSNLRMVRENWPSELPFPDHLLIGGGLNALGSGHEMAAAAGACLINMQYQLNYPTGLTNPSDAGGRRGMNAYSDKSIWVNKTGRRFMSESRDTRLTFPEVVRQPGGTYWAIFDSDARNVFHVSGFSSQKIASGIFNNPEMSAYVKSGLTISELAQAAGLPPEALNQTIIRWNRMVTEGKDTDFGRIGRDQLTWSNPPKIEKPPFYAVQFLPLTRKSMGGVAIDCSCRVTDRSGRPIPGLYAVGELTGLAGVNGKASIEGTFLGTCILTGRVAGRAVMTDLAAQKNQVD